ncbi:MAG: hypothetical protein QOG15_1027 [Solirubrobacteraceae bacterium]|nr:hypothetical protein [Solirubrobacteraceae bacterium]
MLRFRTSRATSSTMMTRQTLVALQSESAAVTADACRAFGYPATRSQSDVRATTCAPAGGGGATSPTALCAR